MRHWLDQLRHDLAGRRQSHLLRQLRAVDRCARIVHHDGRPLLNLAGNDYLGLATHERLTRAVSLAATRIGAGAGASRLVTGHLEMHRDVEARFAAFKHAEAGLILPTGYMANLAALTALAGPEDVILLDKLNHASLIDGAGMSGAEVRVFPHRNIDKLHRLLTRYSSARRRLIVTDSVFSMDGDCADLPALCELRDQHQAILVIDEAHGTGVLGDTGSGLAEHQNVAGEIDVTISTGGKALGSLGGIITARQIVVDTLVNAARPFIYATAAPPTQVAALDAALDVIRDEPQRRHHLAALSTHLRTELRQRGWDTPDDPTPIVPVIVGESDRALALSNRLQEAGFLIPAIRPPTVAPGTARLRISLRSDLTADDLSRLAGAIGDRN